MRRILPNLFALLILAGVLGPAAAAAQDPEAELPEAFAGAPRFLMALLGAVQDGNYDQARGFFVDGVLGPDWRQQFEELNQKLQLGEPLEARFLDHRVVEGPPRQEVVVVHLVGAESAVFVVAGTQEDAGGLRVVAFHWEVAPRDISQRHAFTFSGISIGRILFFFLVLALFVFVLAVAVVCFRDRPRLRWLWIPFILLGIGRFSVPWVQGPLVPEQLVIEPLGLQAFSAMAGKVPAYEPWTLTAAVPVFAIVYLALRGRLRRSEV